MNTTTTLSEKIDFLKKAILELKGKSPDTITEDTKLLDIGIDSLDSVELQMYYEDITGKQTTDPTTPVTTVKHLIDLMH
jgi:acyl carrier protein